MKIMSSGPASGPEARKPVDFAVRIDAETSPPAVLLCIDRMCRLPLKKPITVLV